MSTNQIPFNVTVMNLTKDRLKTMKPVRVMDRFEPSSENFHEEGLYSTSIFGRIGSDERDQRFSYIDIGAYVFHPYIYNTMVKLKGLYRAIMSGRGYAVWDTEIKDFVQSDEVNGQTGFHFFMQHWRDIEFKKTGSVIRDKRIEVIEKYKDQAVTNKVLVLPAGLRELQFDDDGNMKEDEINTFYRRLIGISNVIGKNVDSPVIDTSRWSMQLAFNSLYKHLENLVAGKDKFIEGKWAKRKLYNGTRNVISTMDTAPEELGSINTITPNHTIVGLYETMKGVLPMTKYYVRTGIVADVFNTSEGSANLVNPKTWKQEQVRLSPTTVDRWTSNDGIEKIVNAFADKEMRSRIIDIEGYYLALIYLGPDGTFKVFHDIDELPENFSREYVYPLNYVEMFYLSQYHKWYQYGVYITRYPASASGSVYPSFPYVKTTIQGEVRRELDPNWQPLEGDEHIAREFPSRAKPVHMDSLVPHASRLAGLGADFDGDTASANFVYSDNAIAEVNQYLQSTKAYVDPNGGLRASPLVDTNEFVVANMTGD